MISPAAFVLPLAALATLSLDELAIQHVAFTEFCRARTDKGKGLPIAYQWATAWGRAVHDARNRQKGMRL